MPLARAARPPAKARPRGACSTAPAGTRAFVDEFENVVAEEDYIQDSAVADGLLAGRGGRGGDRAAAVARPRWSRVRHRDLRSDFLLRQVAGHRSAGPVPRRHPGRRRRRCAIAKRGSPSCSWRSRDAMDHAEKIGEEARATTSANMRSTLGNPVLALGVLQQSTSRASASRSPRRPQLRARRGDRRIQGIATPAMIHGEAGRDLMAHGRVWIDGVSGRVIKTELQVEQPAIRATVTTIFHLEDRSGIAVPLEMREQYPLRQRQSRQHRRHLRAVPPLRCVGHRGHPHAARAPRRRMDRHEPDRAAAGPLHDGQLVVRDRTRRRRGAARRRNHASVLASASSR